MLVSGKHDAHNVYNIMKGNRMARITPQGKFMRHVSKNLHRKVTAHFWAINVLGFLSQDSRPSSVTQDYSTCY